MMVEFHGGESSELSVDGEAINVGDADDAGGDAGKVGESSSMKAGPSRSRELIRNGKIPRASCDTAPEFDEEGFEKPRILQRAFQRVPPRTVTAEVFRGLPRTSSLARVSVAIRRSLRLPSRKAEARLRREREDAEFEKLKPMVNTEGKEKGNEKKFSAFAEDVFIGPSSVPSQLDEIRENLRLHRIEKVKKIVRKTDWPPRHEVRAVLWKELCTTKDWDSSTALYGTELEIVKRQTARGQTPQFMKEDGVVVNNYQLNEIGTNRLLRLLTVVERLRPELVAGPMLCPLGALMMHYMDDKSTFACLNYMLTSRGFLLTSPVEWAATSHTILALVKKHKANAYTMLKRRIGTSDDVILVKCMGEWLHWVFRGLPLGHIVRVVDCFLVEGHKFLIRSAISVVYIWAKMQKGQEVEDFTNKTIDDRVNAIKLELHNAAINIEVSCETFIETAVKIRNLQTSTILRLQAHYEERIRIKAREDAEARPEKKSRQKPVIYTDPFESDIVDMDVAIELIAALPPRVQLITPVLLFRLSEDGASFTQMWNKIDHAEHTLFIIRSVKGDVFGAYCSSCWAERNDRRERAKSRFFGTGESFVWRMNFDMGFPEIYNWVGQNVDASNYFMSASAKYLLIGSGDGDAIRIADELTHGISSSSRTFGSPPLVEGNVFDIHEMEIFEVVKSPTSP